MVLDTEVDLNKGPPFGPLGLPDQTDSGLHRSSVPLSGVTWNTRADDVIPVGGASPVSGDYVVQIQIPTVEYSPAVLAGVFVPLKNIVPGKFDLFLGKTVVKHEKNDPGYSDFEGNGVDTFRVCILLGQILPLGEVESLERAIVVGEDDLGASLEEQG